MGALQGHPRHEKRVAASETRLNGILRDGQGGVGEGSEAPFCRKYAIALSYLAANQQVAIKKTNLCRIIGTCREVSRPVDAVRARD
jgi:hypothetical protein